MAARRPESAGALIALTLLAACGASPPEQVLLRKFFEASRLYDRTALAALGNATFNPVTDGIVREFTITRITSAPAAGGATAEEVSVIARVSGPDGRDTVRNLTFTLERRDDRWTIARLRE